MNNHHKRKIKRAEISGAFILLILVGAYGLYAVLSDAWPFEPALIGGESAVKELPTITWPTFHSERYNYEFKYPPEFTLNGGDGSSDTQTAYEAVRLVSDEYPVDGTIFFSLVAYEPTNVIDPLSCRNGVEIGTIVIGGITAMKCAELINNTYPSITVEMTRNGVVYYNMGSEVYTGEHTKLIDTIMRTFRFTK